MHRTLINPTQRPRFMDHDCPIGVIGVTIVHLFYTPLPAHGPAYDAWWCWIHSCRIADGG